MSTTETLTGQVLAGRGLSMSRGGRQILSGLDIVAEPGEVLALTGPSGSGKSSLLSVLGLLERPDDGVVVLGDRALSVGTESVRTSFGLVLQGYGLVSMLTAAENVELPLQARGLPPAEVRERAAEELTRLGLPDLAERLVDQLSGGQQQRVAVARALAGAPPIILADEPTAALDPTTRQLVLSRLFAAAHRGAVVVLATHDREVADQCDREVALADGRVVVAGGPPAALPRDAFAAAVRDTGRHRVRADAAPTGPAERLVAAGVTYARGGRQILTGVDLDAHAGRLLAVTGPSGAGKSSMLALLAALDRPDQGMVSIDGRPVDQTSRARCGLVLQGYALLPVLTAAETVELPLQRLRLERQVIRTRAHGWLERLGLDAAADQLVEELSGGQQQRLAIARALVTEPEIVLADEPTAELDAENRDLVCRLLAEQAARGAIVVLATHDEQVADWCADRLHLAGRVA